LKNFKQSTKSVISGYFLETFAEIMRLKMMQWAHDFAEGVIYEWGRLLEAGRTVGDGEAPVVS
jgi:hypothetical protein